jgi:hypothetical protein
MAPGLGRGRAREKASDTRCCRCRAEHLLKYAFAASGYRCFSLIIDGII